MKSTGPQGIGCLNYYMDHQLSIFTKILILIFVLLLPTLGLYVYSYHESITLIEDKLRDEKYNNLKGVYNRIIQYIEQISIFSYSFLSDPLVEEFRELYIKEDIYQSIKIRRDVLTRLSFQLGVFGPEVFFTLYDPLRSDILSIGTDFVYEEQYFLENYSKKWFYQKRPTEQRGLDDSYFICHFDLNILDSNSHFTDLILESGFSVRKIYSLLNLERDASINRFLLLDDGQIISAQGLDSHLTAVISEEIISLEDKSSHDITLSVNNVSLLVQFIFINELNAYLVDYTSFSEVISPLEYNKNFFYLTVLLLLGTGILAAFILYRNVQVPITLLINGFQRVHGGDFSTRLQKVKSREFKFLVNHFNSMTKQIETLIQDVYEERINTQEAVVKQLQSQINPHFLYNCLFYIKNMARMGDEEAVVSMSLHLADYFRYTTRTESFLVPLKDEIEMINNYLAIQKMRLQRLHYVIKIDQSMEIIKIPRLIIQPIVENAVVHGIENNPRANRILITGNNTGHAWRLTIKDNGKSMTGEDLVKLQQQLNRSLTEEVGCGLWNVNRRLKRLYPDLAGLQFELDREDQFSVFMDFPMG